MSKRKQTCMELGCTKPAKHKLGYPDGGVCVRATCGGSCRSRGGDGQRR
jgi:hypothetical protein